MGLLIFKLLPFSALDFIMMHSILKIRDQTAIWHLFMKHGFIYFLCSILFEVDTVFLNL